MNFRYILEQNNKDRLDGEGLSDSEFEQVKNQLQFSSFYKAGEWLVGENGKVMVHVQRDMEKLHLVVMNHEHIAGGSSAGFQNYFLIYRLCEKLLNSQVHCFFCIIKLIICSYDHKNC